MSDTTDNLATLQALTKSIEQLERAPFQADPTLPVCPLCNAPARTPSLGAAREKAHTGTWSPWMLEHDCDCDITRAADYQAALHDIHARQRQQRAFASSLPTRYRTMLTQDLRRHDGNAALLDAAQGLEPGSFLYAWGSGGLGKTHALLKTAHRLVNTAPARYVLAPQWLEQLRQSFDEITVTPDLTTASVLLLDDLGKEKPSPWVAERVFELVEHYWSEGKTLLITSQYRPDVTAERLYTDRSGRADMEAAKALMSRLGSGVVVRVSGVDERMKHLGGNK